ncbi:hypothetical protein [Lacticaseibacillus parakribbianus]|uniref:hypothetical protein n=1 Tax=Lacticaseibacillus parakribbianus TaxID=2970927 RepID=UPI0021CB7FC5|nr:hypothetical protein [Lacticaseibacillus parakribbianus]
MKKIAVLVASLCILVGCSAKVFDQKAQMKDATQTVITQVAKENQALDAITTAASAFPSTFQKAYQKAPTQDFKNTGSVARLITRRDAAYQRLETAQKAIEHATTTLIKARTQTNANLPTAALSDALNGLKLAKLDHKTFDAYYKELGTAESEFFSAVAQSETQGDIDTALTRLNQYDSSLAQQAEIVTANLQTVTVQAKALAKAIAKMD